MPIADLKTNSTDKKSLFARTKSAVIVHKLLSEPLWLIYSLVGFILCKSLHASTLQVTLLTMLKPSVGLLILYWSYSIHVDSHKLRSNLMWAGILGRIPFLIFPWIVNPWLFIICAAIYIFFYRASSPAWIEIIKLNISGQERGKIYSFASALAYAEGFLISLWIIPWLVHDEMAWRWCFPLAAIAGMISIFVQMKVVPYELDSYPKKQRNELVTLKDKLIKPWKEAISLMSARPDFLRYQVGFFLCGFGLMMAIAILPMYCSRVLDLSIAEFATARLVCLCIGYVISSKYWSNKLNSVPIFAFMAYVIICFIVFGLCLILASFNIVFLYVAYFIYGISQAGSHLGWTMSGPIFSKEKNSTAFTSINSLMVGVRGCVAPVLGSIIYVYASAYIVFSIFILFSFIAIWVMIRGLIDRSHFTHEN